ncbi:MAG TPA: hypothetical protein VHP83_13070 [Aggregatilineaceae bacterium]|nr:hypothetical protein [Aggregatilineaceae bacterium]
MSQHKSLEITINVTLSEGNPAVVRIAGWQFDIQPEGSFHDLSSADRAEFWRALRDEIDEFWFSAALDDDEDAAWNYRLEDVDLG